jgi:gamma-glutamylcyclotransferase (GGCT)/AIG2-like uncharacterized protein YtfP
MNDHLFVYGTLLSGIAPTALAQLMSRLTYLGPASVPGRLYDLGLYPAAIPDAESAEAVRGELYAIAPDVAALSMLDNYEGHFPDLPARSLFRRIRVSATRSDGIAIAAWMYAWNRPANGAKQIAGGDYRAARASQRTTG